MEVKAVSTLTGECAGSVDACHDGVTAVVRPRTALVNVFSK